MELVVGENGKRMDLMSKNKDYEVLYALRDKKTKKIVRATKCKGGSFYKNRYMCEKRCTQFNDVHKLANCTNDFEYEVGEDAVVDIEKYKDASNIFRKIFFTHVKYLCLVILCVICLYKGTSIIFNSDYIVSSLCIILLNILIGLVSIFINKKSKSINIYFSNLIAIIK